MSRTGAPRWQEQEVLVEAIDVSGQNTRKDLQAGQEDASLDDLARSIQAHGLLQPPLMRPSGLGRYEVIAGQRRILACRKLGLTSIRARFTTVSDDEAITVSLIENVQRADMRPLDKAQAFEHLRAVHGTVTRVSLETGVGEQTIRRYLDLLVLPAQLKAKVGTGDGPSGV
jgi:ParB family chromosome partitioning protein